LATVAPKEIAATSAAPSPAGAADPSPRLRHIWLCADDYGISDSVNTAIRDLVVRGRLNATSAMVVAPSTGDPLSAGALPAAPLFHGSLSADASRYFHVDSLRAGKYDVVLGGAGVGTETIRDVAIPWTKSDPLTATLVKGETLEIGVGGLALKDAAKGLLLDAVGKPVMPSFYFADPVFNVRPGTPSLTFGGLKPGNYTVKLALPTGQPTQKSVVVSAGQKATVSFP